MSDNSGAIVRGTGQLIRDLNRSRILECFVGGGPLSRVDVAERTGISLPAVSQLVAELEEQHLLVRVGMGESSGGRRPVLYEYNPRVAYVIGLDMGGTKIAGGVSDLQGNLLASARTSTHGGTAGNGSAGDLHRRVKRFVTALLDDAGIDLSKVMGIGIGVPGIPDASGREIRLAPGLAGRDGRDAPSDTADLQGGSDSLVQYLESELGRPVYVDNDVNMIVRGERWKGALRGVDHGLCVTVGTGIGAGLLLDGQVYRGARGAAGEIGYWLIGSLGPVLRPKGYGPLERFAAGPGIARRYRRLVEERNGENALPVEQVTARETAEAALEGDEDALLVWRETVDVLGVALANLASLVDPETIVIGGGVAGAPEELFLGPLREVITTLTPYPPRIVGWQLGERAGIYGAVSMVVHSRRSSISYLNPEVRA